MKRVLIANRGEIACRIIRGLKSLKIETVAVYSMGDKDALHVKQADRAVCIGEACSKDSYLNISRIIAAAEITGADAIAPGYGFLSENATFAQIVEESGLTFIGPSSLLIRLLGDKIEAKKVAKKANCPTIPGTEGEICTIEEGLRAAEAIGFPVFIKASAGGGGKGIRCVHSKEEFGKAFKAAKEEARLSFNSDALYLEKRIEDPKHIEVQVAGDKFGNIIHLYERDCTLQRRRQKLIEETLSPSLTAPLREKICSAAVRLLKEANYHSLGTVEFLLDKDENFYFMEVNTRLQVEHTITEELTRVDLVKMQIEIAQGKRLEFAQQDIIPTGYVMEFRINAEDPELDFRPCPGFIRTIELPVRQGVRIDTSIYSGYRVPPYYDSMIAKVIVWGTSREDVINKSKKVLREFSIDGIKTTIPFHLKMLEENLFLENKHTILSIDEGMKKEVYS